MTPEEWAREIMFAVGNEKSDSRDEKAVLIAIKSIIDQEREACAVDVEEYLVEFAARRDAAKGEGLALSASRADFAIAALRQVAAMIRARSN
ncbi:MAG TPA: hypothetical protein VFO63_09690 [Blastocatellia bacterium]|nr:hypothetical protein [Blastocatellia bacterium]